MAKQSRGKARRRGATRGDVLPLEKSNYVIIAAGLLLILAGYLAMLEGSVEGFLPLDIAPILLVLGYCVVIPIGILYRKRKKEEVGVPADVESKKDDQIVPRV